MYLKYVWWAGGKLVCKNLETIQENIGRKLAGVVQLEGLQ